MPIVANRELQIRETEGKIGRNDQCFCGSGKKYKKCHWLVRETTAGRVKKVIDWLTERKEYEGLFVNEAGLLLDKEKQWTEMDIQAFSEMVMFEGKIGKQTAFEWFVEKANLSDSEREYYEKWRDQGRFSFFRAGEVYLGKGMKLVDYFSGENFFVVERMGTYGMMEGDVLALRLMPHFGEWMSTGGIVAKLLPEWNRGGLFKMTQKEFLAMWWGKVEVMSEEDVQAKAIKLMHKQKYLEALEIYSAMVKTMDGDSEKWKCYNNVATCLGCLGEVDLAKKYLQKSLEMNPNYELGKKNLAASNVDSQRHRLLEMEGRQRLFEEWLPDGWLEEETGNRKCEMAEDMKWILGKEKGWLDADKLVWLHSLTRTKYFKPDKNREEFLEMELVDQICKLLELWSKQVNWASLAKAFREIGVDRKFVRGLQSHYFGLIANLLKLSRKPFKSIDLLDGLLDKKVKIGNLTKLALEFQIDMYFVMIWKWLGFVTERKNDGYEVTEWGRKMLVKMDKEMRELIPEEFKKGAI